MIVHVDDIQEDLPIDATSVAPLAEAVLALEGARADELSVQFADTATTSKVHALYFDDASITDCMSFPLDPPEAGYRLLGDVVVCPKVALNHCHEHGGDPYEEATLYLVHGILHLLGYNDIEERDRAAMRQAEERHMNHLRTNQLLLSC
jgi:probable rRNA maturation factor